MVQCITLEMADGTVGVRGGVSDWFLSQHDGDRDAALQDILDNYTPTQNPGAIARIEDVTFPPDNEFRNAWTRTGPNAVAVDMPKARQIHLARIRAVRDDVLARSDTDVVRAQEDQDATEQTRLKARRQALRNMPADIQARLDSAGNPTALTAVWPATLNRP